MQMDSGLCSMADGLQILWTHLDNDYIKFTMASEMMACIVSYEQVRQHALINAA